MEETLTENKKEKKDRSVLKFVIYIVLVLGLTAISLFAALYNDFDNVIAALTGADPWWLLLIFGLVLLSYAIDSLVILIFCRLYTRQYGYGRASAVMAVGAFYNCVTPAASGEQVMQVYCLRKQGISTSNAASIMVMWFIIYQVALIVFDVIAIAVEWNTVAGLTVNIFDFEFTMVPLIVIGFLVNIGVTGLIFLMSNSHHFHNFITVTCVGLLGKMKILKNPERTRESLRVQVENFKIELRRLLANIPVTVLVFLLFIINFFIRFSLPYFCGLALDVMPQDSNGVMAFFDASFLSAFHQMVTGLIPTPGTAGVSELFFVYVFRDYYSATNSAAIPACQILWRFATYHVVLVASGIVVAFYRGKGTTSFRYANRQTFVNLQLETYVERKKQVETLYQTIQLSRKSIVRSMEQSDNMTYTGDAYGHYLLDDDVGDEEGKQ